ncbi:MAG: nicotinate phosphoribosyltransferase, partial [Lactobacillus sp.]|nr:nicotinate phosphoribosyltransferase [Lactobacillus sp.]
TDIKNFCAANLDGLWDEYKRSLNPQEYPVDLSQDLYDSKMNIIQDIRTKINKGDTAQ